MWREEEGSWRGWPPFPQPKGMMRVEKYEKYDFQPLVRVGYQGMEKRYETMILIFLPIASAHGSLTVLVGFIEDYN